MYSFKVAPCANDDAHDWTECPFAHPGALLPLLLLLLLYRSVAVLFVASWRC
jgi:hypothetical protein